MSWSTVHAAVDAFFEQPGGIETRPILIVALAVVATWLLHLSWRWRPQQ